METDRPVQEARKERREIPVIASELSPAEVRQRDIARISYKENASLGRSDPRVVRAYEAAVTRKQRRDPPVAPNVWDEAIHVLPFGLLPGDRLEKQEAKPRAARAWIRCQDRILRPQSNVAHSDDDRTNGSFEPERVPIPAQSHVSMMLPSAKRDQTRATSGQRYPNPRMGRRVRSSTRQVKTGLWSIRLAKHEPT